MVQHLPETYQLDPADPRAPSEEEWDRMTPAERTRVVAMLPLTDPVDFAPEGDPHRKAKYSATETLDAFFRRIGRKIYVSSELGVYYPGEKRFSPDVLAVVDAETHERTSWVVSVEGKGLDCVIEVLCAGDRTKDKKANVERYARLGIREYFMFDRVHLTLRGHRLPEAQGGKRPGCRSYQPILPQQGRYASEVLGLDLMVEGTRLRFLLGMASVPDADELIAKLGTMLNDVVAHQQEAEEDAVREAARADAEAARADELGRKLAEVQAELDRLKRGG